VEPDIEFFSHEEKMIKRSQHQRVAIQIYCLIVGRKFVDSCFDVSVLAGFIGQIEPIVEPRSPQGQLFGLHEWHVRHDGGWNVGI
jgi:hypothetical protein